MKKRMHSFLFAFQGMKYGWRGANFKIQALIGLIALIACLVLEINKFECLVVLVCTGMVLALELFNSALESLADTLHPAESLGIKKTKDQAAAAVLVMSLVSLVIACWVFIPAILLLV